MKNLILAFILFFIFALNLTPSVLAAPCNGLIECVKDINSPATTFTSDQGLVGTLLSRVIPIVIGLGGMLTVVFIVISGFQFVTSSGDPKGAEAARAKLIYAVIGFVVLILAYAALQIIDKIFLGTGVAG